MLVWYGYSLLPLLFVWLCCVLAAFVVKAFWDLCFVVICYGVYVISLGFDLFALVNAVSFCLLGTALVLVYCCLLGCWVLVCC